jgi:hypothetical protein
MAALATQNAAAGGAVTTAAATGGGDTIESGWAAAGWHSPTFLLAVIGVTATTITLDGTAYGPFTSQTVVIPANSGGSGRRLNITYNQVASVTVGAVRIGPQLTGITFGT